MSVTERMSDTETDIIEEQIVARAAAGSIEAQQVMALLLIANAINRVADALEIIEYPTPNTGE